MHMYIRGAIPRGLAAVLMGLQDSSPQDCSRQLGVAALTAASEVACGPQRSAEEGQETGRRGEDWLGPCAEDGVPALATVRPHPWVHIGNDRLGRGASQALPRDALSCLTCAPASPVPGRCSQPEAPCPGSPLLPSRSGELRVLCCPPSTHQRHLVVARPHTVVSVRQLAWKWN